MSGPPPNLLPALQRLRAGDRAGARAAAEQALATAPADPTLLSFLGILLCQNGDAGVGADYLRRALEYAPRDLNTRVNLATALVERGKLDDALVVCSDGPDHAPLRRISAYVHQERGRLAEAASDYAATVGAMPGDFESWNNLGNVRAAMGDTEGAIEAFEQAIAIRPDIGVMYINLSKALVSAGRDEDRRTVMRKAAQRMPQNAEIQAELGLAEAAVLDFGAAEQAYREAIRLTPGFTPAYVELGLLLEYLNRVDALIELVAEADARGIRGAELDFIRAWALRRQNRFEEARAFAEAAPPSISEVRRAQLIGDIADRLGDTDRAYASYNEMNRAAARDSTPKPDEPDFLAEVRSDLAMLTPERVAGWSRIDVDSVPASPIFIVGFPRSGTTLLDTLLMNIPQFHVLEELPVVREVADALGSPERIASIDSAEANALRARYFEVLDRLAPPTPGKTVVDKFPLHMARMPLVNRLFPDAKIVFVERHPCDVVLSCFMANFQLNRAMRHFGTLEGAAQLYDIVLQSWTRARALLPIDVHVIRYERMIVDLETEMRQLLGFLGVDWDPAVLDNRGAAARRDHIRTASYSQVTEPIYGRAAGRWERYRAQMEGVLDILRPWAERMNYPL